MDTTELRAQLAELHALSFGWALSCCRGDRSRAEDVLQAAYLKVLDGKARFGDQSAFKTWFFGVVRNTAREEQRRQWFRRVGLLRYEAPIVPTPSPESELGQKETCQGVRTALEKLSPRQREVLHLVFYQDLTLEESAGVMGVSLGSARTHYARGKEQLRKLLPRDSPHEDGFR